MTQIIIGKYLKVIKLPRPKKRKTDKYELRSMRDDYLGEIYWFGRWRQYCIFPSISPVVFNSSCLDDISKFLQRINMEHKTCTKEDK